MHILITGGTGLIGTALCAQLAAQEHVVTVWTRRPRAPAGGVAYVTSLEDCTQPVDIVVNLAGANLADRRWSRAYKAEIRSSRIDLTQRLVTWIGSHNVPPGRLISASAIGYYGASSEATFDEASPCGRGFAASLCEEWEQAALGAAEQGVGVVILRLGVVLAGRGSALQKMTQSFRFGIESWLGSGEQWLSWIHLTDVLRVIAYAMTRENPASMYNAVSPEPVCHRAFAREVGQQAGSLLSLPVPGFLASALAGEMAEELLLNGQRVLPDALLGEGFQFNYPTLALALQDLLGGDPD